MKDKFNIIKHESEYSVTKCKENFIKSKNFEDEMNTFFILCKDFLQTHFSKKLLENVTVKNEVQKFVDFDQAEAFKGELEASIKDIFPEINTNFSMKEVET